MTVLDQLIQRWRIRKVRPFLTRGDKVLDIGCSDGILFRLIPKIHGVGVDPTLNKSKDFGKVKLIRGYFPEALSKDEKFDKICMLAVLEHIPVEKQPEVAKRCFHHLNPNGYLLITVPSMVVDRVLDVLTFLCLVDGIEIHQHYGFKPSKVPVLFEDAGLQFIKASKFQLGLNNLFVFKKLIVM